MSKNYIEYILTQDYNVKIAKNVEKYPFTNNIVE